MPGHHIQSLRLAMAACNSSDVDEHHQKTIKQTVNSQIVLCHQPGRAKYGPVETWLSRLLKLEPSDYQNRATYRAGAERHQSL